MDKMKAVGEAIREVLGLIEDADGREMVGRRKPKVEIEVEAGGGMGPEHEEEEMALIQAMEGLHEPEEDEEEKGSSLPSMRRTRY